MSLEKQKFPVITVVISILLGCLFLGIFYLAVSNEPDYMPSQKHKQNNSQVQNTQ
ncbi:hypothetical protein [Acinetobacter larvae]|uniref:hypothetical protein n=1 Tax=Acinetobacter larvae TaxID=1789224 RepID=UPI000B2B9689|nr:hypothetical protein [Acinetobacter larvae]